ncbi:MAG: methyltransferase domain-containing protein [Acidobacteria bacterium]|nr:methyltransferase domain-containing protein [Acidobacteriota bacterium]
MTKAGTPFDTEPTKRFTERVANYAAYRPKYPAAVVEFMRAELGLSASSVVADVGAGTGIWTEMLLREGGCRKVFAVEPNDAMRAAAENSLGEMSNFESLNGTAEATTLDAASVDFVTAAQAFHWFDARAARAEFARILKPGGWLVLLWNMRRVDTTPFLRELERILRAYGTDYERIVAAENPGPELMAEVFPRGHGTRSFAHEQVLDYEALRGRWLSASYVPLAGHPNHEPMFDALRRAFDERQRGGVVSIEYESVVYYGQLL